MGEASSDRLPMAYLEALLYFLFSPLHFFRLSPNPKFHANFFALVYSGAAPAAWF